ncbi:MAG: hypothetical protein KFH87_09905, partial [Bacteroidetes bacterium]|nr:hypothetical protein [Bacteroidota bacterium]
MNFSMANISRKHTAFVITIISILTFGIVAALAIVPREDSTTPIAEPSEAPRVPQLCTEPAAEGLIELHGEVRPNMPFITAMLSAGIARPIADTIRKHLEHVDFNFRACRPGQSFTAQIDSSGLLHAFRYNASRLHSYWILPDEEGALYARTWETPVERELRSIEGH